ncbi:cytochrome P450 [Aspergillus tanneri]|nr:uncharacterized protein ATNIH1004_008257 [Aspergillus tanneri]KAA8644060.1 hypothetical protein ATNIH1004_008257 [Aspergillus tanneri]
MRENLYFSSKAKVQNRLNRQTNRPDFWTYILRHNDEKGMSVNEMEANAELLIAAGSETTASLLSGWVYHLLTNPSVYKRLADEIRGSFQNDESIDISSIGKLSYLHAVLEESLRMYPPVPAMFPRKVPKGGAFINGQFVHEGTSVAVAFYSAFRATTNFTEPDSFLPERWLQESNNSNQRFASDIKEVLQPFSYGPRNCLGKNLANAEMRLIATKLLWNFDMSLEDGSDNWEAQKSYNVWQKKPLMVKLTPVQH